MTCVECELVLNEAVKKTLNLILLFTIKIATTTKKAPVGAMKVLWLTKPCLPIAWTMS